MKYKFIVEIDANFEPSTAAIAEAIENGEYDTDEDGSDIEAKVKKAGHS